MFLQLFIPTWKFFDRVGTVSTLYYRDLTDEKSDWKLVFEKPSRHFLNLFHNPEGNLYLAYAGLVERLVFEIGSQEKISPEQIESLDTYRLVQNMVVVRIKRYCSVGARFQFKIQVQSEDSSGEDFLISKELAI